MDVKTAIAAVPWLRRAWRLLPGPLKLPILVIGALYALYRWRRDDEPQPADSEAQAPVADPD